MKKSPFLVVLILAVLSMGGEGWAQNQVPIGVAAWRDTVTGAVSRAMGPGGAPTLNYLRSDSTWDWIVDTWAQVGDRQVWKSVRGNHRVFADSTGAAIYAKGNHYLGTQTTHLVKFDKSDSTWATLRASLPDSVRTSGREIVFHGIFPGIDKKLVNNAKVFQQYAETFVFHQQARDSLAAWGPWTGYMLGTATKLTTDSLNLTLRDAAGVFGIDVTGRMVNEWVSLGSADTSAFYLGTAYLQTEDSTTSIPVKKWLVRYGGSPWLVELFDPIAAGALPAGDVWHNATFGNTSTEASTLLIENRAGGGIFAPASSGDVDSVTAYVINSHLQNKIRIAVFDWDGPSANYTWLDTTTELTLSASGASWRSAPAQIAYSIVSGTRYALVVWGSFATGSGMNAYYSTESEGDTLIYQTSGITYSGNGWNDVVPFNEDSPFADQVISIYCTYTEAGAPVAIPSRRRQLLLQQHGSVQGVLEHFAGVTDEIPK